MIRECWGKLWSVGFLFWEATITRLTECRIRLIQMSYTSGRAISILFSHRKHEQTHISKESYCSSVWYLRDVYWELVFHRSLRERGILYTICAWAVWFRAATHFVKGQQIYIFNFCLHMKTLIFLSSLEQNVRFIFYCILKRPNAVSASFGNLHVAVTFLMCRINNEKDIRDGDLSFSLREYKPVT